MALSFSAFGQTQVVPGVTVQTQVQNSPGAVASTGVIVLVGEANQGPDFSLESDLNNNFFSPGDLGSVQAKYGSGRLVDAFNLASAPSNDPNIPGSPSSIFLVKTNVSTKASAALVRSGLSNYGVLADRSYGAVGNGINFSVSAATNEVAPTTGSITWIPSPNTSTLAVRSNGGAAHTLGVSNLAGGTGTGNSHGVIQMSFIGGIISGSATGLSNLGSQVMGSGGVERGTLNSLNGTNLSAVASGNSLTITLAAGVWANNPVVGDTLVIPANGGFSANQDSVIGGGAGQNFGQYVVTAFTNTTITALKLRNNVPGALVSPVSSGGGAIHADTSDVQCFTPVVLQDVSGTDRGLLTGLVGQNVTCTVVGNQWTMTLATGQVWHALPQPGDIIYVPLTAPGNISNFLGGWSRVVSASSGTGAGQSQIVANYFSNGSPTAFGSTTIAAVTDIQCLRPVIDGVGKSLEIFDGGGSENIQQQLYTSAGVQVGWVSSASTPQVLVSASEYSVSLNDNLAVKNLSESIAAGGSVALLLGYKGTTATCTVSDSTFSTSVSGGFGASLSIPLSQFTTLGQLASYVNSQTGYSCSVATAAFGQLLLQNLESSSPSAQTPRSVLDVGTFGICSDQGAKPGRIKVDASSFFEAVAGESQLVQLGSAFVSQAAAGLPEVQALTFLAGGAVGGSSNTSFINALLALQSVVCNFICPLVSQDATADIAIGQTDASSTYTVDAVNAALSSHVDFMSGLTIFQNRQGFASVRRTYSLAKLAAQNLANFRVSLAFLDYKAINSLGNLVQFQPWMSAVDAMAMQAAGGYKPIVHKFMNTSGTLMFDGSFNALNPAQRKDALQNGLYFSEKAPQGGYRWVSDQTTYSVDDNFVFNSIQAVYDSDIISLTLGQDLNSLDIGQSLADLTAGLMQSQIDSILDNLVKAKWVATSDAFPKGYGNVQVKIQAPGAQVSLTAVGSTGLYFIAALVNIAPAQSSAG